MSTWQTFWDSWPLFANSVLAATVAGAVLGFLGVYIVLRRMIFLSAALSQVAGFGVTLAFLAQLTLGVSATLASPSLGAMVLTLLFVGFLLRTERHRAASEDALLGVAFLVGSAGTLIVGTRIVQELQDVESLLFGTAVAVLPEDFLEICIVGLVVTGLHLWWRRGFVAVAIDRTDARVRGLPVKILELVLLASVALVISVTTRTLGALPAFAFSVLPAMASLKVSPNINVGLALAAVLGGFVGFAGYYAAYAWDLPVGASQTVTGVVVYLAVLAIGRLRRAVA